MFTLKKGSDGYLRFVGADGTCREITEIGDMIAYLEQKTTKKCK